MVCLYCFLLIWLLVWLSLSSCCLCSVCPIYFLFPSSFFTNFLKISFMTFSYSLAITLWCFFFNFRLYYKKDVKPFFLVLPPFLHCKVGKKYHLNHKESRWITIQEPWEKSPNMNCLLTTEFLWQSGLEFSGSYKRTLSLDFSTEFYGPVSKVWVSMKTVEPKGNGSHF